MTQFGKRLIKGLKEAVVVAKGEVPPARIYTDADVAKIRTKLKRRAFQTQQTRRSKQ